MDEKKYDQIMTESARMYKRRDAMGDPYAFHKAFEKANNAIEAVVRERIPAEVIKMLDDIRYDLHELKTEENEPRLLAITARLWELTHKRKYVA